MEYSKSFVLERDVGNIQSDLFDSLKHKGFAVEHRDNTILAKRGSGWSRLYSFDITKYKTQLVVSLEKVEGNKRTVSFRYEIDTAGAFPTPGDAKKLDAEMATILSGLQ